MSVHRRILCDSNSTLLTATYLIGLPSAFILPDGVPAGLASKTCRATRRTITLRAIASLLPSARVGYILTVSPSQ